MVRRPCQFVACALLAAGLLVASSTCWAGIGVDDGGKKPGPSETLTFQPVVWEPYIPEFYVRPVPGAEGHPKAVLSMEKLEGELPGIHQAWKFLKERFKFDELVGRNEAGAEIVSGWTRSETGFLVHASSEIAPSGDKKLVQQMIAEAPALFYVAVGIDFGDKKLKADREAYLLDKYFKAVEFKITAHQIESQSTPLKLEEIRGTSSREPFLTLVNLDLSPSRPWTDLGGALTSTGAVDQQLAPWRVGRLTEMRLTLEVEGKLEDTEESKRKKAMGAIRFIVLDPKSVDIGVLNREEERK